MKLRFTALIALAIITTAIGSPARAQFESTDKSRLGIRLSIYNPLSSELKNLNKYWIGPTLDFHVTYDKIDRPQTILSLSWFSEEKSGLAGGSATMIPFTATYVKHYGNELGEGYYAGAGVGLYFVKYASPAWIGNTLQWVSDSGSRYGVNLFGGLEFGGAWFAEMRYDVVGSIARKSGGDVDFSGLTIAVGSRLAY